MIARMMHLKPYWGRIAAIPSAVDEVQFPSGLIAPLTLEPGLRRAVVESTHESHSDNSLLALDPGTVVYYFENNSIQIGEVDIVHLNDVVAFEDPE